MASENSHLQSIAGSIIQMLKMIDEDRENIERIKERAYDLAAPERDSVLAYLDLAVALSECPSEDAKPQRAVMNPRFRRGTAMKPVAWADCLWQPPGGLK